MLKSMICAAAMLLSAAPLALADTPLGITGAELRLGASSDAVEGGFAAGTVDVAITPFHGAQFDLQYEERQNGGIGRLGTTLYMMPRAGQKYGLFLMVADKNDASATYGQIGATGMFQIAPRLALEMRGGIGVFADHDLDWVTAGAGLHWQASPATRFYGQYDIASFDEAAFAATGHEVTLGIETRLGDSPASLFAEVSRDWRSGRHAASGDTVLRAGVSIALGRKGNDLPRFHLGDPMGPLLRRGVF